MQTKHSLFHVLGKTPKSRAKVSIQWRILKPRGSLLLTVLRRWFLCIFYFMFIGVGLLCRISYSVISYLYAY